MKRKLKIDMDQLELAMETECYEMRYYLDLETGRVILITEEMASEVQRVHERRHEEEAGTRTTRLEEYLEEQEYPDWQIEMMLDADRIERESGTRYIRVEAGEPNADYRDMERFILTVEDPELRDRLWRAIQGRGAFRYFKDVLLDHLRYGTGGSSSRTHGI